MDLCLLDMNHNHTQYNEYNILQQLYNRPQCSGVRVLVGFSWCGGLGMSAPSLHGESTNSLMTPIQDCKSSESPRAHASLAQAECIHA